MKVIVKILKNILNIIFALVAIFAVLKLIIKKLEDKGIIKYDWIVQKTPCGKGLRCNVSLKNNVFFSIQL